MTRDELHRHITREDFDSLFFEKGWDDMPAAAPFTITLRDNEHFEIQAKYQKRGFAVCFCQGDTGNAALRLNSTDRRRLLYKLSKHHYEHLLIITGTNADGKHEQHWLVSIRQQDRPLRVVRVIHRENKNPQALVEKLQGLVFPMAEEENLTIADVVQRVRFAFNVNTQDVTKKFYEKFKTELSAFEEFIKGIKVGRKEYTALMLNRLMFIYFIQKKGFLNGETNYLKDRLQCTEQQYGCDKFHDKFYRHFLRRLFHKGLDTPPQDRPANIVKLLGKVPYLNGGLFDEHKLEAENDNIQITDSAFIRLFKFFDTYNWHLDNRTGASGRDINPDVLGHIFEKYINDRAQMGAYYTQEDITGYIAKNTILPFLLQRTRENCKNAFIPSGVWRLLQDNPNDYIYDAVKHGCDLPSDDIPQNIRDGIPTDQPNLLQRRQCWNTPAPENFALPTETWREVIARRARYTELHNKMQAGDIGDINDLITHNLDIARFVHDALNEYEGADFIAAFFRALAGVHQQWCKGTNEKVKRGISVLDPACGSGAFLFAALNVLEPLYEICLQRMEEFVQEYDAKATATGKNHTKKHPFFRKVLAEANEHPNRRYWIYKTLILGNLYGVDIMQEATEIAKLRLFLKLAAEAEYDEHAKNCGLAPLPDIDFNIRTGNALVGYTSMKQFNDNANKELALLDAGEVREQASMVAQAHTRFKQAQDSDGTSRKYKQAKEELTARLAKLNEELNLYLAQEYGHGRNVKQTVFNKIYDEWETSHQPFHWFAEFYGIIEENGGFDVVIGNPPYVEYSKVNYTIKHYQTLRCGNLYAFIMERCLFLTKQTSFCSMIVPLSGHSTPRMKSLIDEFYLASGKQNKLINLSADANPSKLFPEVKFRLCIFLSMPGDNQLKTTGYSKWYAKERDSLFSSVYYTDMPKILNNAPSIAKVKSNVHGNILSKISECGQHQLVGNSAGKYHLYYHNAPVNWVRAHTKTPYFTNERHGESVSRQLKQLFFHSNSERDTAFLVFTSTTFFLWWQTFSDCYHLNRKHIIDFPFQFSNELIRDINNYAQILENDMQTKSKRRVYHYPKTTGRVEYDEFYMKESKNIIDEIDKVLAKHYNFTEEELDYIINYDIKYRMGGNN